MDSYLRQLADLLGLRDWRFLIGGRPDHDDAMAQVRITYGRREAVISLSRDWETFTARQQRETLTHELLHCHFDRPSALIRRAKENTRADWLPQLEDNHHEAVEHGVDAVAVAIAAFLPLPPETA